MWPLVVQSAARLVSESIDKLLMRRSKKQKTRHEWRVFQAGKFLGKFPITSSRRAVLLR
jgi:hypothetical protein